MITTASTDEVYGSTESESFSESDLLAPSSPYSASKTAADHLVLSYRTTFGLPVLITRSTNNFGPYQFPEKLIPLFVTNLLEGKQVPLYGDGLNARDWIYVLDNCRALETVLRRGVVGKIYNVGAANEVTNRFATTSVLESLGVGEEMVTYVADRPGHDRRYSVTTDKIRGLGWAPPAYGPSPPARPAATLPSSTSLSARRPCARSRAWRRGSSSIAPPPPTSTAAS